MPVLHFQQQTELMLAVGGSVEQSTMATFTMEELNAELAPLMRMSAPVKLANCAHKSLAN